ncbi:unnamed protein product [Prorocentrum cordatum]|uniref:Anaphase-promoting complex subunit 1 n=1 Tax=Prorocentrum cordatum TaxID=2364126 RepID=A0ABN9T3R3_9DINO|nr:unnamed protein product [Polarella glacialis]
MRDLSAASTEASTAAETIFAAKDCCGAAALPPHVALHQQARRLASQHVGGLEVRVDEEYRALESWMLVEMNSDLPPQIAVWSLRATIPMIAPSDDNTFVVGRVDEMPTAAPQGQVESKKLSSWHRLPKAWQASPRTKEHLHVVGKVVEAGKSASHTPKPWVTTLAQPAPLRRASLLTRATPRPPRPHRGLLGRRVEVSRLQKEPKSESASARPRESRGGRRDNVKCVHLEARGDTKDDGNGNHRQVVGHGLHHSEKRRVERVAGIGDPDRFLDVLDRRRSRDSRGRTTTRNARQERGPPQWDASNEALARGGPHMIARHTLLKISRWNSR